MSTQRQAYFLSVSVGRIFSRERPIVDFPGVARKFFAGDKSAAISFYTVRN